MPLVARSTDFEGGGGGLNALLVLLMISHCKRWIHQKRLQFSTKMTLPHFGEGPVCVKWRETDYNKCFEFHGFFYRNLLGIVCKLYANWDSKAWRYHWFFLALSFGISFHRFQLLFALLFLQKKKFKWFTSNQKPSCRSVSTCICIYIHVSCRAACRSAASKSVDSLLIIND